LKPSPLPTLEGEGKKMGSAKLCANEGGIGGKKDPLVFCTIGRREGEKGGKKKGGGGGGLRI